MAVRDNRSARSPGRGLLCATASVWLSVVACNQDASLLPISGTLWAHLKEERFGAVTSMGGLPLGVRDALHELFHSPSLDIAEPGAEFQSAAGPGRRLVAAGCSNDHCLVYYERGLGPPGEWPCFTGRRGKPAWSGAAQRRAGSRGSMT